LSRRQYRNRVAAKLRHLSPRIDALERRELLAASPVSHPMFQLGRLVSNPNPPSGAYTPAQIEQAYGFNQVSFGSIKGDGTGQTIAIVDAQDDPNIQADLNVFDAQFGLPAVTVNRVNQTGGTSYPATDSTGGWELEESLDVEWAHAIAPGAQIILVEANSANDTDLLTAVKYASAHANVVSMSWGGSEFSGQTGSTYDGVFSHAGVAFVASSGDSGAPISWPAAAPNVLAVGGTSLTLSGGSWTNEVGWSGSGGGPSAQEPQPSYQSGVVTQTTTHRANPDVAYDADPNTGYAVYDSFAYQGTSYGWLQIGGTSAGAPQWAALLAIADQGRALSSLPAIDSSSPQEVMTTLYKSSSTADFHDITSGTSTGSPNYSSGPGYDYVTGLGSPRAALVIQTLVGTATTMPSDHLVIGTPASATAGAAFTVTVTADNARNVADSGYTGTITFSSSDVQAGLPSSYTFTAADAGSHTFTLGVTLKTAGNQTVSASDSTGLKATSSVIAVSPAAASQFLLAGLPSTATVGTPVTFSVTAKDAFGNVSTGYTGTVAFTSSDTAASLLWSYKFVAADKGAHSFSVTFSTPGSQSLTVTDTNNTALTASQSRITVSPAAPTNLTASAVSSSEIDLSWTSAAGASGYTIQRSASGSSGWTQISTTTAGVTSYKDMGLTAGTTYYYRVQATSGSFASGYSNTASATTQGSNNNQTTDTLWSNSYTPSENAYSYGSYEVGVKFTSDVAGTVTGVRFYKQTWMSGYTHVGHLWSSTGALLATAAFTSETGYGWQQVNFSSPVSISPNTVYIVSFSTGGGYFGISTNFFNNSGVNNPPLHALANTTSGGDGVYHYGNGTFPNVSGGGMNFWADVAFSPASSSSTARRFTSISQNTTGNVQLLPATASTTPSGSAVQSAAPANFSTRSAVTPNVNWPYRQAAAQGQTIGSPWSRKWWSV
jgi:hypothetical protein